LDLRGSGLWTPWPQAADPTPATQADTAAATLDRSDEGGI
jgi:hypothetical protein